MLRVSETVSDKISKKKESEGWPERLVGLIGRGIKKKHRKLKKEDDTARGRNDCEVPQKETRCE
jgi:hypothetical protein